MSTINNEQQFVATLINALRNPSTVMSNSVIAGARKDHPALFNRALSQYNNQQRQSNRPLSTYQPVVLSSAAPTPVAATTGIVPAHAPVTTQPGMAQSVNNEQEELESLDDDEPDFEEFDEAIAAIVEDEDEDESIEDDDVLPLEEVVDELPLEEDFDDEEPAILADDSDEIFRDEDEFPVEPEEIATIENLSFKHSLSLSLYLNSDEGELYQGVDGKYYTSKQPLRRGKGEENDATGAVRASLENFIEGVRAEGDGIRFPVAVTDTVVDTYIDTVNSDIERRLSATFDPNSNTSVVVTSTSEPSENPWGGNNARIIHRNIALRFSIPAIVSVARKGKDDGTKMLESNLKIVNNLVRTLHENANLENVQVNILIEDACAPELTGIYLALISDGNAPTFDRGYARFSIQADDVVGGEIEG